MPMASLAPRASIRSASKRQRDGVARSRVRSTRMSDAFLAAASFDGTVSGWDKKGGKGELECNATLEGHENEVKGVSKHNILGYIVSGRALTNNY